MSSQTRASASEPQQDTRSTGRPTESTTSYTKESFKCSECGCRVLVPGDRPDSVLIVTSEAFPVDWYSCPVCGAVVFDG